MYYQKSIEQTLNDCQTTKSGLSTQEALSRQEKYGKNELAEKKKESPFLIFLKQFQDLLVIILIVVFGAIGFGAAGIMSTQRLFY